MPRISAALALMTMSLIVAYTMPARTAQRPAMTTAPVTFTKDVLPILQKNCQSCHRPGQIEIGRASCRERV